MPIGYSARALSGTTLRQAFHLDTIMRQLALPALLCICLITACGKKEEMSREMSATVAASAPMRAAASDEPTVEQLTSSAASETPRDRQLIREASARFQVKDVYQSSLQIENITTKLGGFVTQNHISSQQYSSSESKQPNGQILRLTEYALNGEITLRVPSANTQALLHEIAPLVVFLNEREFTAQDVALELLQQQLAQARSQANAQALNNPASNSASQTERILAKNQLQAQQEMALLQSKLIADQVAFSTINLKLYQERKISRSEHADISAELAAVGPSFGAQILTGLHAGWNGALAALVALSYLWPLLLLLGLMALAWRTRRLKQAQSVTVE